MKSQRLDSKKRQCLTKIISQLIMLKYDSFFTPTFRKQLERDLRINRKKLRSYLKYLHLSPNELEKQLLDFYPEALLKASRMMERRVAALPQKCPFSLTLVLDESFVPAVEHIPLKSWQAKDGLDVYSDWQESSSYVTSIYGRDIGLPMSIWALEKPVSKDACAIAVSQRAGRPNAQLIKSAVLVSVGLHPKVLFNQTLKKQDFNLIERFIQMNRKALRRYWSGKVLTSGLFKELVRLDGRPVIKRDCSFRFTARRKRFEVWIWPDKLHEHTLHFKNLSQKYEAVLNISHLSVGYWIRKPKGFKRIPKQDLCALVDAFKSPNYADPKTTNWEALVRTWHSINSKHPNPLERKMPAYDQGKVTSKTKVQAARKTGRQGGKSMQLVENFDESGTLDSIQGSANLGSKLTDGLPKVIHIWHQGGDARGPQGAMVKASFYADRFDEKENVSITVSDDPQIVAPQNFSFGPKFTKKDFAAIRAWIVKRKDRLQKYWNDSSIMVDDIMMGGPWKSKTKLSLSEAKKLYEMSQGIYSGEVDSFGGQVEESAVFQKKKFEMRIMGLYWKISNYLTLVYLFPNSKDQRHWHKELTAWGIEIRSLISGKKGKEIYDKADLIEYLWEGPFGEPNDRKEKLKYLKSDYPIDELMDLENPDFKQFIISFIDFILGDSKRF